MKAFKPCPSHEGRGFFICEAESIGWLPLGEGAYLHVGKPDEEEVVITVTGIPDASMIGLNVLLVG